MEVPKVPPKLGLGPKLHCKIYVGLVAGNLLYATQRESKQRCLVVYHACDHAWTGYPPKRVADLPFMTGTLAT